MEGDMNQSAGPVFCRSGCGFYGSSATDGLCSKCFKDSLKKKNDPGQHMNTNAGAAKIEEALRTASLPFPSTSSELNVSAQMIKDELATTVTDVNLSGASAESSPFMKAEVDSGASSVCASSTLSESGPVTSTTSDDSNNTTAGSSDDKAAQKKPNRCDTCRKKVGLTGFECRCGGLFCGTHRYSDMHQCQFDYKALGQQEIRKNNPVVKAEKIEKL